MKATSIFGGVQVFNIIITIVRSKLIAILLGPAGMGISGLFTSTLGLISSITNLGLARSAVRDIASANASGDEERISETVSVFRKLVWITGGVGLAVTLILSPLLSFLTFGNYDYTVAFIVLSSTLLIGQLTVGQSVLLQGLRKISWLAKAGIYSSVVGLLTSIPMYFLYGIKGIVPAILIASVSVYLIQYYFAKRIIIRKQKLTFREAFQKGNGMIKLGVVLGLNGLIATGASYLIRIFISRSGSLDDVGLYTAGFAIINTYVGMVFSAMITDYFPRLAAVHQNKAECNKMMNQQIEVALYIISPLICIFLVFINWIIILIYSTKFLPIVEMIQWGILAIFFKTLGWAIGVLVAAKGHSKHYFWNELTANIYLLLFNILGYYFMGLKGLGLSFLLGYFIYFLQIYFFTKIKYGFTLEKTVVYQFVFFLIIGIVCFAIIKNFNELPAYLVGGSVVLLVSAFSFYQLDKRTDLIKGLKNKIKRD